MNKIDWRTATFETISYFKSCNQWPSIPTMNMHILDALKLTQCTYIKEKTLEARAALNDEKLTPERRAAKYKAIKQALPCVTFSGGFVTTKPRKIDNGSPTHTIVLDIDHISDSEYTVDDVKDILFEYPSVYWVQSSCSGDGVFALVYISDKSKREAYFNWFNKDLKDRYNIKLDKLDDITRLRFICWDESPLAKDEIIPCVSTYEPQIKRTAPTIKSIYQKLYDEMHTTQYTRREDKVEHLSHPDRMKLFNSLRCIYNDDKEKVLYEWDKCMRMMTYGPQNNTNLHAALEEPAKNKWFDYQEPHISYKILFKFYDKKEIKRDEAEQN